VRSHRTLYFSALALVATLVACTGFDVPRWTSPAGQSIESTEPEEDDPTLSTEEEDTGAPVEAPPGVVPDSGSSEAADAGDAAPSDAGPD
jgi:hypothetical protein